MRRRIDGCVDVLYVNDRTCDSATLYFRRDGKYGAVSVDLVNFLEDYLGSGCWKL